jgi:hypothetical protein
VHVHPGLLGWLVLDKHSFAREGPGWALPTEQRRETPQLARTPRTAGQLGLAELAAGYPVDAEGHLAAALQTPDDPSIAKYRKILTDALATARSQIGELSVDGNPVGAEVTVDGRAVGVLPLSAPLKLAARSAEVVVRAPGYEQHKELVPIAGGQRRALTVSLEKIAKPPEATSTITPVAEPPSAPVATPTASASVAIEQPSGRESESSSSTSALRTVAWVTGGAAVVAAGAGVALNLAARSNRDDFNGSCVNMNGIHVVGQSLTQAECEARADAWQSDRRWSIAGYVSGTALAVTSGILFWMSRPTSPASDARAQVTCTPTPTGLSCQGLF